MGFAPSSQERPSADPVAPSIDINNPLAIVIANLDYVIEDAGCPRGELRAALRDARAAAERIRSVVARAESTRASLEPSPVSTSTVFTHAEAATGLQRRRARVLVVDDEPMMTAAIRRNLGEYEVVVTVDGHDALGWLARGDRFDVILCDVMMPDMPGFELYAEIERMAPDQAERVIFITGGATTARAREFVDRMSDRVIEKPCDMQKLRDLIRLRLRT